MVNTYVREFHRTYGVPIKNKPEHVKERATLRLNLLQEEFLEYIDGESHYDLIEIADALADMVYIIYGTALEYGIPLDAVLKEVHGSNMSKLDENGKPITRTDGKVLKGPSYYKPRIKEVLNMYGGEL